MNNTRKKILEYHQLVLFECNTFSLQKSKLIPPKTLPFSAGTVHAALLSCAHRKMQDFLQRTPNTPTKSNALIYLQIASELAATHNKLKHSIHWLSATHEVRLDVAQQLDEIREIIAKNLEKFCMWWEKYLLEITQNKSLSEYFLIPDWITSEETQLAQNWRDIELSDFNSSLRNIQAVKIEMSERLVK